ncbi:hypothetical protein [Frondihabitans cladoniiphilus]|uniref:Uncharacterized protein n=1 Tax=Frondihabitans cladoniiphilus TaxID=715785 RepID=A0ABP8W3E4_9MICO
MAETTYSPELQSMIDRAGSMTADEVEALGRLWKNDEDIAFPPASFALGLVGEVAYPVVTNEELVDAWQRALDAAGAGGRVDEIHAAQEAGRATTRDVRHQHDDARAKDGAEEAVRSAVLATGVRDLISDDDFRVLTAAWSKVLGAPQA